MPGVAFAPAATAAALRGWPPKNALMERSRSSRARSAAVALSASTGNTTWSCHASSPPYSMETDV